MNQAQPATSKTTNPMDDIVVRPLRFDYQKIEGKDPVWSRTHPLFSIYINALGVHIPYFERYLMMSFRSVRNEISDPQPLLLARKHITLTTLWILISF